MGGGVVRGDSIPLLLSLISSTPSSYGVGTNTQKKNEIKGLIDEIGMKNAAYASSKVVTPSLIEGTWDLLWTTEKETLFFAQRGLFGKPVTRISQTIDLRGGTINNLIEFEGERSFSVVGGISIPTDNTQRVDFVFKEAVLKIPPLPQLRLPPVGQGWFDTVYVNNNYRLSRDSRGDYLVCKRAL